MEKFKDKALYKKRLREQTVKNLIIKVEQLYNKSGGPIGHKYYYSDTKEFTLSKPEQKLFIEKMKALGFMIKHKKIKKTIYVHKSSIVNDYLIMNLEVMEKIQK